MITIQVNIGDDYNQSWVDVTGNDFIVFSNGYLSIDSGFTGLKRIVHEFKEVDTPYARYCHLMKDGVIHQVNYNGEKLYNALSLFYAHPDQSNTMCKNSFRVVFMDYYIDWIKTPQMYTTVPAFFYSQSKIDTLITPFFYTTQTGIQANHILEADEIKFIVTGVDIVGGYNKVWVKPYDGSQTVVIDKEKYLIRDYNVPMSDSTLANMTKILFHDEYINLSMIPTVDFSSDNTELEQRNFRTIYEWIDLDISNLPFELNIDSSLDLSLEMMINDFTMNANFDSGDNALYGKTSKVTSIKKGDYLLIKNSVYSEIIQVTEVNISQNSYAVSRPFKHYEFLMSDDTVKLYWCKRIPFQPVLLNNGANRLNYPILFTAAVKYLNI